MEVNDANGNINPLHYQKLHDAMTGLARFIQTLKDTPYGNKKMIDMVNPCRQF